MFNLGKINSDGGAGSGSAVPSVTGASASLVAVGSTTKKRPSIDEGLSLRKRNKRGTSEQITDASGSTTRVLAEKGKELVELKEAPEWGYTIQELCEVEDRVGSDKYFTSIMMRLRTVKGEDPLVPSVLIDRVHDAGRLVRSQHERILALQAVNKELKLGASQDLVAAIELHAKGLEEDVKKLRVKLEGGCAVVYQGGGTSRGRAEAEGLKAVTAYKASREFESSLEQMGRVNYEFRYRVALERLWGKHPEIAIEQDLFI
ncbi:hypothetical protein B296_00057511 [Ensete ventricosum]|uniref:Uncharacterized protein n=1 Tax=Ensete ventricosum TaxID=4639 RepID=A0A426XQS0_ENSVE|nr:hypothetical protein B296_00057511 [Ensete ventricosum]